MPAFPALDRAVFEEFLDRGYRSLAADAREIRAAGSEAEEALWHLSSKTGRRRALASVGRRS